MAKINANGGVSRRSLLIGAGVATLASALKPIAAAATQPHNEFTGSRESFDAGWLFQKGDHPNGESHKLDDSQWRKLDLPHDWSIEGPYGENELAQGSLPTGIGWYRKHFTLPKTATNRLVSMEFDGIYQNSEVWINEHYLGKRPYGYVPFYYDLTPYLHPTGENVLAVKVDNSHQPNSRWYSGSGIYRHTWLNIKNQVHIAPWGVFVTTPSVSKDQATVQVKTRVVNAGQEEATCRLTSRINPLHVATAQFQPTIESTQTIPAHGEYEFIQQLSIGKPSLWTVDQPFLHGIQTEVSCNGQTCDLLKTSFGIREAVFDAHQGFLLNGERVKLNGVCLHHEAGCFGAAVPEEVWRYRLEALKKMGCNAIRTSHNPPASEFLDICDEMGFLVMAEAFDEWRHNKRPFGYALYFDEWYERDVENFVRRDRNHPSIVLWSCGNEIPDQSAPEGAETVRKLKEVFKREDPTRLVTAACDQIASEPLENRVKPDFLKELDVVGYNYVDRWRDRVEKYYDADRQDHPDWRVIGTESGSMGGTRDDYSYLFPGPNAGFLRGSRGRMVDVEQFWKFVRLHDYVAGDFMWTGIDYLGESRWPGKGSASGVIDSCGFKKDGFYFYQSQWITQPVLHIFPHWTWPGKEGQYVPVTCYTNCDTVELFVNGKSAGVQGYEFPRMGMEDRWPNMPARARVPRTTADLHLCWTVPYEPGSLKAIGMRDGKVVYDTEVFTAGPPARLSYSFDGAFTWSDSGGYGFTTFQVEDAKGHLVPDADHEITFTTKGDCTLVGVDNGDPMSHEDYKTNHRKAFHGMCFVAVKIHNKVNPQWEVVASSPGLDSGSNHTLRGTPF